MKCCQEEELWIFGHKMPGCLQKILEKISRLFQGFQGSIFKNSRLFQGFQGSIFKISRLLKRVKSMEINRIKSDEINIFDFHYQK